MISVRQELHHPINSIQPKGYPDELNNLKS